jgi:hypothetical protein
MKGFYDIEGTEICVGDEILVTMQGGRSTAGMFKSVVTKIKGKLLTCGELKGEGYSWSSSLMDYGCRQRVLILKGEFKTYTKKEIQDHAS